MNNSQSILLKLERGQNLDDEIYGEWLARLEGADGKTVVIDLSDATKVGTPQVQSLARALGPVIRKKFRDASVICTAETEKLFEQLGLGSIFKCLQVHAKAAPSAKISAGEIGTDQVRQELSVFFGFLVTCTEQISKSLLASPCEFAPPLSLVAEVSDQFGPDRGGASVRLESGTMVYHLIILMSAADRKKLVSAAFRGRDVAPEVSRDLLAEVANNIAGGVIGQLRGHDPSFALKASIPKVLDPLEMPTEQDLAEMKGRAIMQFRAAGWVMNILVGYGLRS